MIEENGLNSRHLLTVCPSVSVEKTGSVMKNEKLADKGLGKRKEQGFGQEEQE